MCSGHNLRRAKYGSLLLGFCRRCQSIKEIPLKQHFCDGCKTLSRADIERRYQEKHAAEIKARMAALRREGQPLPEEKECARCRVVKPLHEFDKNRSTRALLGRRGSCKACVRPSERRRQLKAKYNMTPEDWVALYEKQGGRCAVCRREGDMLQLLTSRKVPSDRRLCVDHEHASGKVRGLLCVPCNAGIGNARENPEILDQMKSYLAEHKETN